MQHHFLYEQSDIPEGMTLKEYRYSLKPSRKRRRRWYIRIPLLGVFLSEREAVMAYLKDRYTAAFMRNDTEEAVSCHNFYTALEVMSDAQYEGEFCEPVEAGAIS